MRKNKLLLSILAIGLALPLAGCSKKPKTFTVTWKDYDGTILEVDEGVKFGEKPTYDGEEPHRDATAQYTYTFDKWSPRVKAIEQDTTYVAKYKETVNEYTITWVVNGSITEEIYQYGDIPYYKGSLPITSEDAYAIYEFTGWSSEIEVVTADKTYIAQYSSMPKLYEISWYADGELLCTEQYQYGDMPEYKGETPSRPDDDYYYYTFEGWYPEVQRVTGPCSYNARLEFHPLWHYVTVDYDQTKGYVSNTGRHPFYDSVELEAFPKSGYAFYGWFDTTGELLSLNNKYTADACSDTILYAVFDIVADLEKDFSYTINEYGECIIDGLNDSYDNSVVIPPYIKGHKVTQISSYAFEGCTRLISLKMPDTITILSSYAFKDCTSLKYVTLSKAIEVIQIAVFSGCTGLDSFTIPSHIQTIDYQAFYNCSNLKSITIPSTVTYISQYVFLNCTKLKTVEFGASVTSIPYGSFNGCSSLESINIPDYITMIEAYSFYGCSSLASIFIPISVSTIEYDAFTACSNLTIYAEVESKPDGWYDGWNFSSRPVVWGYHA